MKLVLLRHGESEWNKENRFTGWTDIDLTKKVYRSWKLNEKSYGDLQGLNKAETTQKYGEEQVLYLDNVSDSDIVNLNIPTGIPLVYELDENLHPIRHYYLGDAEQIKQAEQAVANQASVKH